MEKQPQSVTTTLIAFLAFFFFITFPYNCTQKKKENTLNSSAKVDSVFYWLDEIKKNQITPAQSETFYTKAYKKANDCPIDSLKIKYFSKMQWIFMKLNDSVKFRKLNKEFKELTISFKDSSRLAGSYWDLAAFYKKNGIPDSAYYAFGAAEKLYAKLKDTLKQGKMFVKLAGIQADTRDYTGSESNLIKAIGIFKLLNNDLQLFHAYVSYGSVLNGLNRTQEALNDYNKALLHLSKVPTNDSELRLGVLNDMGVVYQDIGDHEKALPFFKEVLEYKELKNNDIDFYATCLNNYAYSKFKGGDNLEVENMLKEAIDIRDSLNLPRRSAVSHHDLAEFYLYQKDTTKALNHALKSLEYAKMSSNNKRHLMTLNLLSSINPKNALAYHKEYISLSKRLTQEERKVRNKFARIEFETEEVIAENQLLSRQRLIWIGIAIALMLLTAAAITIFLQRAKNQKLKLQQQQQEANQEIFELMLQEKQKVEEGKQAVQKRISEELHDSVVGQMHSIRMMLLGLNKKADDTAIALRQNAIEKLNDIQEEVRTISHELNDAAYQKIHNFIHSVEELLYNFQESSGITTSLEYKEELSWDALNGDIKINLYRVIQESLQNSAKHAKAKSISLSLDADMDLIYAVIVDDGVGFDPKKAKQGIGLKNIKSRIEKINGAFSIDSIPMEGTTVKLQIPHHLNPS